MNHSASSSTSIRRIGLVVLAVLGLAGVLYAFRRMALMAAPVCLAGRWHGCFDTENGLVLMTLVLAPVSGLIVCALAGLRRALGVPGAWRLSLAEVGMVHGTVPFLWMTLMPGPGAGVVPGRVSLVPLRDLVTMGWPGIVGNLLVFAALGFFGPLRFPGLASVSRVLLLAGACSALVEVTQYVCRLDRVSSVDDVLLNAAGAGLAALASRHWWRRKSGSQSGDRTGSQSGGPASRTTTRGRSERSETGERQVLAGQATQ
ncbi:hypothetical protein GCM10020218_015760 [Dactylosporangium vinaceum]|uniref:VanZ family protein n=1 Tax=Dactylosporangium vinaceum TaxID=53362 RepID=A0ABV5M7A2_9ACTN|nr:VanZ family protein [Dactylosporangium vinaceum]